MSEIYGGKTVRCGENSVHQRRICKLVERIKRRRLSTVTCVGDQRIRDNHRISTEETVFQTNISHGDKRYKYDLRLILY
jgi:hypothetical protein